MVTVISWSSIFYESTFLFSMATWIRIFVYFLQNSTEVEITATFFSIRLCALFNSFYLFLFSLFDFVKCNNSFKYIHFCPSGCLPYSGIPSLWKIQNCRAHSPSLFSLLKVYQRAHSNYANWPLFRPGCVFYMGWRERHF